MRPNWLVLLVCLAFGAGVSYLSCDLCDPGNGYGYFPVDTNRIISAECRQFYVNRYEDLTSAERCSEDERFLIAWALSHVNEVAGLQDKLCTELVRYGNLIRCISMCCAASMVALFAYLCYEFLVYWGEREGRESKAQ